MMHGQNHIKLVSIWFLLIERYWCF